MVALTMAGALGGWALALERARAEGGRLPLPVLLEEAIRHARDGFPVSRDQATTRPRQFDTLKVAPGFAETFLSDDKLLSPGTKLRLPKVGDTLEQLARAGLDDFYRGDIGRELANDLARQGSPITRADFDSYRARYTEPLAIALRSGRVVNSPPPSQGLASLIILGVADRLQLGEADSLRFVHGLVEATKRAFSIRDRIVTDPARLPADPAAFLTAAALDREAAAIDFSRAAGWPAEAPAEGDTIWMGAVDGHGRAVSYIQSLSWEWGSGCVLPQTGLLWHNRGAAFSLDPRDLNYLEPGRKPYHTLNAPIAVLNDGRVITYGCMGADGQPQTQSAIFTRHVGFGLPIAQAVDLPRWRLGLAAGASDVSLRLEPRFPDAVVEGLMRLGHPVELVDAPYHHDMGHAGMIILQPDGRIEGVHDPRSDGGAAAL